MVFLHKILLASLAMVAPLAAQITSAQVVDKLDMMTQKSQDMQRLAQRPGRLGGLLGIGLIALDQIVTDLNDIGNMASSIASQMQSMPLMPAGPESKTMVNGFTEFTDSFMPVLYFFRDLDEPLPFLDVMKLPVADALKHAGTGVSSMGVTFIENLPSEIVELQGKSDLVQNFLRDSLQFWTSPDDQAIP
ncbi:hypothetical protein DE146DRAFT_780752 [Phaeosphaeria sp. MPI-PUGE-AT-0046c]|nr:hypothetical protein DE146DRAFT_780752 [Phaeosphaeria sp. MPI-PUGE-AT-0046c]